jgi:hypothetical protein
VEEKYLLTAEHIRNRQGRRNEGKGNKKGENRRMEIGKDGWKDR